MIYLGCFLASSLALHYSVRLEKAKRVAMFAVAVLIMVLLAALRSVEVGIDTAGYAAPLCEHATLISSVGEYIDSLRDGKIEIGYTLLTYVAANYMGGLPVVLGLVHLVIVGFAYARLCDFKDEAPVWLMTMVYLLMFYNQSLNLLRQSMAMSIVFFASRYIGKRNTVAYIVAIGIAMLFHRTAFLGFGLLFAYLASIGNHKVLKTSILAIGLTIGVLFFVQIFGFVIDHVLSGLERYRNYLSDDTGGVSPVYMLYSICVVAAVVYSRKEIVDLRCGDLIKEKGKLQQLANGESYIYFLLIVIFNLTLSYLRVYGGDNYRFALYFSMFIPVILPQARKAFPDDKRKIIDLLLALISVVYWFHFFVINNDGGTWPYLFNMNL